jgi:hypothetical protein
MAGRTTMRPKLVMLAPSCCMAFTIPLYWSARRVVWLRHTHYSRCPSTLEYWSTTHS